MKAFQVEGTAYAKTWPQPGHDPGEQWETSGVFQAEESGLPFKRSSRLLQSNQFLRVCKYIFYKKNLSLRKVMILEWILLMLQSQGLSGERELPVFLETMTYGQAPL